MQEIQNFGTDNLRGVTAQPAAETPQMQDIVERSDPRRVSSGTRLLSALAGAQGRVPDALTLRQQKLMRALGEFIQAGGNTESLEEPSENGRQLRSLLTRLVGKYPELGSSMSASLQRAGLSRTPPENIQLEIAGKLAALPRDLGENSFIGQNVLAFMDEAAALQLKPEEVSSGILSIMEKCGIAPEGISDPRAKAELSKLLGEAAKFIYENADAETSASLERPVRESAPRGYQPYGGSAASQADSESRLRAALDAINSGSGSKTASRDAQGSADAPQRPVYSLSDIMRKGVSAARIELPPETENILSKVEVILKKAARIALESKLIPPPQGEAVKPEDPAESEDLELENLRYINKLILENKGGSAESLRKAVSRVMEKAAPENADESADTLVKLADRAIRAEIMRNGGRLPAAEQANTAKDLPAEEPAAENRPKASDAKDAETEAARSRTLREAEARPKRAEDESARQKAPAAEENAPSKEADARAAKSQAGDENAALQQSPRNSTSERKPEEAAQKTAAARTAVPSDSDDADKAPLSQQHREIPADDAERAAEKALRESLQRSMAGRSPDREPAPAPESSRAEKPAQAPEGHGTEKTAAKAAETSGEAAKHAAKPVTAGSDAPESKAPTAEEAPRSEAQRQSAAPKERESAAPAEKNAPAAGADGEDTAQRAKDEAPKTLFEKYQGRFTGGRGSPAPRGDTASESADEFQGTQPRPAGDQYSARRSALSARYGVAPRPYAAPDAENAGESTASSAYGRAPAAESSTAGAAEGFRDFLAKFQAHSDAKAAGSTAGNAAALPDSETAEAKAPQSSVKGESAAQAPAGKAPDTPAPESQRIADTSSAEEAATLRGKAAPASGKEIPAEAIEKAPVKDSGRAAAAESRAQAQAEPKAGADRATAASGDRGTAGAEARDTGSTVPSDDGQAESAKKEKMSLFQKITAFFTGKRSSAEKAPAGAEAARAEKARAEAAAAEQKVPLSVQKFIQNAEINGQKPADAMLAQSGNPFIDSARHIFNADEIGALLQDTGSAAGSLPKAVKTAAQVLNRELTAPLDSMPAVMQWLSFTQNPLSSSAPQGTAFQQWAILLLTIRMRQLGTEPKIGRHCIRFRDMVQDLGIGDNDAWPSKMLDSVLSQADRFQQAGSVNQENGGLPLYFPLPTPEKNQRENAVSCGYTHDENGKPGFDLNFYFEIKDLGPVQIKAHVSMPEVSVTAVTDNRNSYTKVSQTLGLLKTRLDDLGLRTGDFQTVSGTIRHPKDTLQETAQSLSAADDGSLSIEV